MDAEQATLRLAANERERRAAYELRYRTYVEEYRVGMSGAVQDQRLVQDSADDDSVILVAVVRDEVVGTARVMWGGQHAFTAAERAVYHLDRILAIVPPERVGIVERVAVRREHRNGPLLYRFVEAASRYCVERGAVCGLLDCEPHLLLEYQQFGCRPLGPLAAHPEGVATIPLMILCDVEALTRIGSPLAALAGGVDPAVDMRALRALLPDPSPVRTLVVQGGAYEQEIAAALQALPPGGFQLDADLMAPLLPYSFLLDVPPLTRIIAAGMMQRTMYLLVGGAVDVLDDGIPVGASSAGEVIGEVAFLLHQPRMSEVRTGRAGATLLGFSMSALAHVLQAEMRLGMAIYAQLAAGLARKVVERQRHMR